MNHNLNSKLLKKCNDMYKDIITTRILTVQANKKSKTANYKHVIVI